MGAADSDSTLYLTLDDTDVSRYGGQLGHYRNREKDSAAELTGSEAGAPTLYAVTKKEVHTLRRSDNAGATWQEMTEVDDYWSSLSASILDPNLFAWGGVVTYGMAVKRSSYRIVGSTTTTTSTVNYTQIFPASTFYPTRRRWRNLVHLHRWRAVSLRRFPQYCRKSGLCGLRVSQYYTTHISIANPNHVAAGAQDQGYQRTEIEFGEEGLTALFNTFRGCRHSSTNGSHVTFSGRCIQDSPSSTWVKMGFVLCRLSSGERTAWLPLRRRPYQW